MFQRRYFRLREEIAELQKNKPWLKAVKRREQIRRDGKNVPPCPHCHKGVRAEDLASRGVRSIKSDEMLAGEPANKTPAGPELAKK